MSNVLEIKEFEIEVSDAGTFAHFEAVVDEIRQGAPATRYDAPEFYPAHCVATVRLSDDDDLSAYEHDEEVMELAESISDWEPADPTDQEMMSAFGTPLARRTLTL